MTGTTNQGGASVIFWECGMLNMGRCKKAKKSR